MSGNADRSGTSYFDDAYRDYAAQNPPKKLDHYLNVVSRRSPDPAPTLLDIGCGLGLFLERASQSFPDWDLSGVDIDQKGVTATSARVRAATIRQAGAESLPFEDDSFDVITAWDTLEHVADLDRAFSEIKRCLRDGGLLALVVPVYDGVTGPLIRLLDRDPTHLHKRSRDFWIAVVDDVFDQVEWHGIHRYLLTKTSYIHRPTRKLRRLTAAIMLSARNK